MFGPAGCTQKYGCGCELWVPVTLNETVSQVYGYADGGAGCWQQAAATLCLTSIRHAERAWAAVWQVEVLQAAQLTQNTATGAQRLNAKARHAATLDVSMLLWVCGQMTRCIRASRVMIHLVIERATVDGLAACAVARREVASLQWPRSMYVLGYA